MTVGRDPDPLDPDPYDYDDEPPVFDPWYRRYWGYYNRPYGGCGCLYTVAILILLWFLLSLLIPDLAIWDTGIGLILSYGLM